MIVFGERALLLVAGLLLVAAAVYDVLVSVIVPRPVPGRYRVTNLLVRLTWRFWRGIGLRVDPRKREAMLGGYAPVMIIGLLVVWVVLLTVGYGIVLWALREQIQPQPRGLGSAIYLSGISLLTIGYGDIVPAGPAARLVVVAEAGTGLGTVALVISMLFSLFANFQRRESRVITLDATAGAPPSGVILLERARELEMPELLDRTFEEWRLWSAEVLESHLAYPMLSYFRSSHDNESWISALGAVLDAATLVLTTIEGERPGPAKLIYKVGCHLVEDLSHFFGFPHDHVTGVERFEFDEVHRRLAAAGYRPRPADAAWKDFARARAEYAAPLNEMARYWAIPPAQWIGDRSYLPHSAGWPHD